MFKTGDNFLVEVVQAMIDTTFMRTWGWECHHVEIVKHVYLKFMHFMENASEMLSSALKNSAKLKCSNFL